MTKVSRVLPTLKIEIPGGESPLVVRGLSTNDIMKVLNLHRNAVMVVWDKVSGSSIGGIEYALTNLDEIVTTVINDFPLLVSDVIAVACGDLESKDSNDDFYENLPVFIQFELINAIFKLTFGEGEASKKMLATVKTLIARMNQSD